MNTRLCLGCINDFSTHHLVALQQKCDRLKRKQHNWKFAISKRSSNVTLHIRRTRLTLIGNTIIKLLGLNFHLVVKKEYNVVPLSASTTMTSSCSPRSKYAWRRLASHHSGERSSVNQWCGVTRTKATLTGHRWPPNSWLNYLKTVAVGTLSRGYTWKCGETKDTTDPIESFCRPICATTRYLAKSTRLSFNRARPSVHCPRLTAIRPYKATAWSSLALERGGLTIAAREIR